MSQSFTKLWIHAIWATKHRQELIDFSIEKRMYDFIWQELTELGCPVRIINGMPDHVHVLFLQNPQKTISDIVKQIKGSSSHFINREDLILEKFAWQTGYAAFSVSESQVDAVYYYIKNQKQHHLKKNGQDEFDDFVKLHGLGNK
ncbi:IS200/IS605 family transposase [Flavobacterium circumlabens]|uniref:IS200/IS605 family transposase n=1 Tax=Flavobacterium circumlabens TaxID=2133765 RepID=A0A4Y7U6V1_9FLAO|nr:IS200/IS605 family transposase [Flavobacterium circumlabens]TCN61287.1 REP element-mobilizing transposase RayT [Flavobacterium circumlabens]TEB42160.1 IS200/IS605 family transposase [Flavobacterium circumlabens]